MPTVMRMHDSQQHEGHEQHMPLNMYKTPLPALMQRWFCKGQPCALLMLLISGVHMPILPQVATIVWWTMQSHAPGIA